MTVYAEESSVKTPTIGTTATMIIRATAMNANADFIVDFIVITLSDLRDHHGPTFSCSTVRVYPQQC